MGIFSKNDQPSLQPKRNNFDLSFQNNLTMKLGYLYPCFCKEVIPGDTFDIDVAFGLRMMPLAFPIQTKLRADVQFFYVRNRNLYEDWQEFITHPDGSTYHLPEIDPLKYHIALQTGELGDYLGLPTTVSRNTTEIFYNGEELETGSESYYVRPYPFVPGTSAISDKTFGVDSVQIPANNVFSFGGQGVDGITFVPGHTYTLSLTFEDPVRPDEFYGHSLTFAVLDYDQQKPTIPYGLNVSGLEPINFTPTNANTTISFTYKGVEPRTVNDLRFIIFPSDTSFFNNTKLISDYCTLCMFSLKHVETNVIEASDLGAALLNFPHINALPFRAYESIYNAFYRDQRNNPFTVNGKEVPNQYIPSKAGGIDSYEYKLHKRNWEQDFLTTALPSPQQGPAPLVGLTSSGVASFVAADGNTYNVKLTTGSDNDTVTGAQITTDIPNDVARSVVSLASEGISINDFRAVNSLQRWLEANFRRGLKYKDQIMSHYGVDISYAELDMPEFLGGVSDYVNIQQINQTSSDVNGSPLGSYAGQGSLASANKHKISKFIDEHGYIIGIVSVTPVPAYAQLCPKHYLKSSPLDYYFPEFNHIGYQPIKNNEVAPLETISFGGNQEDTFGYQRPWYDYLASTDEVHGDFRKTLRDFCMYRVFNNTPTLSEDFLLVDPEQLNNVFSVDDDSDKVLGQLHFNVLAKRPISRFGVPRLE